MCATGVASRRRWWRFMGESARPRIGAMPGPGASTQQHLEAGRGTPPRLEPPLSGPARLVRGESAVGAERVEASAAKQARQPHALARREGRHVKPLSPAELVGDGGAVHARSLPLQWNRRQTPSTSSASISMRPRERPRRLLQPWTLASGSRSLRSHRARRQNQSATRRPLTRSKCLRLCVTRVSPRERACAATIVSSTPIGTPASRSPAASRP